MHNQFRCITFALISLIINLIIKMKEKSNKFSQYYKSLNREDRKILRINITQRCSVETHTIYNWVYAGTGIPPLVQKEIVKITGHNIFK